MASKSRRFPILELHHVSKAYTLGAGHRSLREATATLARRLLSGNGAPGTDVLWALRDVSFELERGDTLALVGANGAGKTTILKLLSRVTRPTQGQVRVYGRASALIELGAGFHPDLSGRENIFLNGSILGLTRKEIAASFDSIVAFSELERFIDTPVKRYSSGMYLRLGFAVAIHVAPDVLLIDEVLAVGDMAFQRKCLDKIEEIRARGTTVVLVSHNLRVVETLCNRALWLEKGQVRQMGNVQSIIAGYANEVNRAILEGTWQPYQSAERRGSGEVQFTQIRVLNGEGKPVLMFRLGDRLILEMGYAARRRVERPSFDVAVYANNGARVCTATTRLSGCTPEALEGEGVIRCVFDSIAFMPGGYAVTVALFDQDDVTMYDQWHSAALFSVGVEVMGDARWQLRQDEHGVVYLPVRWEY